MTGWGRRVWVALTWLFRLGARRDVIAEAEIARIRSAAW